MLFKPCHTNKIGFFVAQVEDTKTQDAPTPPSSATPSPTPSSVPETEKDLEESHFFRNLFFFVVVLALGGGAFFWFGGSQRVKMMLSSRGRYRKVDDDVEK